MPALIIHGHFYQPPRENPWTGVIEKQPGAAPFHDWNERIHAECYRANAFVPVAGSHGNRFLNNYEHISFNFGPTLLSWIEKEHPDTYARIIDADRRSLQAQNGHGNAIAQAYGHAILPLCNERDLRTQIRWGLADFRHRFGREAEALWLPETACNQNVMDALIDEGLRFVILAPHQVARVRSVRADSDEWRTVNQDTIDTSLGYSYRDRNNPAKSIAVFVYDGRLSRAIAFEKLLNSSREMVDAFSAAVGTREMINVATDGETYGHHFKFGDLCLAHTLEVEAPARGFKFTNYGQDLDEHPPELEMEIDEGADGEGTSWSCVHGVGRWIRDCGCQTGGEPGWHQQWRGPLRAALDFLRDQNIEHFESTRGNLFTDPWRARDLSIGLILDQKYSRERFFYDLAGRGLPTNDQQRALTFLELQRMLLLMYTSCGWFFSDISGIETVQILRYAVRAIELMDELRLPSVRRQFLDLLTEAKSNRTEVGSGADIYERIESSRVGSGCQLVQA